MDVEPAEDPSKRPHNESSCFSEPPLHQTTLHSSRRSIQVFDTKSDSSCVEGINSVTRTCNWLPGLLRMLRLLCRDY